ncbi:MAG: hypothetical protein NC180_05890 [Muribaculaceae bacterium]|nr:hypothetical protein [Muribaculaceae bacterium]MCM1492736.1 hypothetical protein [Muribaculaceae bacterium]
MTLQMNYQEKYEQGIEQGIEHEKEKTVRRLMKLGRFSMEEIADVTELSIERVKEIAGLQPV